VPALERAGASVIGVNCSVGPAPMLETIERIARVSRKPLAAQPNAGRPREIEGRNIYLSSPEYLASYARRFVQHGVRLVGGCCGTTPEHIRQIRQVVRSLEPPPPVRTVVSQTATAPPVAPVPRVEKSRLSRALSEKRQVMLVELEPPRGHDAAHALACARRLAAHGVDAVSVSEGLRGGARMSALSLALLVRQEAGIEPVLQYACRDRYLLSMQSDLLGAHAVGIRNVVLYTGDPRKRGDYSDATLVFDVDSIGLTNAVSRLNHGRDIGGQPIGAPTAFHIGVVANPTAPRLDEELRRFEYKVEAGAEYAITQPVFDTEQLKRFLVMIEHVRIPIVAGIWPLISYRNAEFMHNEVPGVNVTPEILERMRIASDKSKEEAREEGITIARESLNEVKDVIQGVQVSAPFGNVKYALQVFEALDEFKATAV